MKYCQKHTVKLQDFGFIKGKRLVDTGKIIRDKISTHSPFFRKIVVPVLYVGKLSGESADAKQAAKNKHGAMGGSAGKKKSPGKAMPAHDEEINIYDEVGFAKARRNFPDIDNAAKFVVGNCSASRFTGSSWNLKIHSMMVLPGKHLLMESKFSC